jgi:chaperone modulatory protein CbpM
MNSGVSAITRSLWIGEQGVLSLEEFSLACSSETGCIVELVELGVLLPEGTNPRLWRFGARDLYRARKVLRLSRDFDADIVTAAVIVDLLDETERLRARLRRAGLPDD